MNKCRICGNEKGNAVYSVHETMFGFSGLFDYFKCGGCGCLQIIEIPADISKYYPEDYYSYRTPRIIVTNPVKKYFKRLLVAQIIGRKNPIGWLLSKFYQEPNFSVWMKKVSADFDDAILDVGCGLGELLLNMESLGFTNLTGADPYIKGDISYSSRLRILKSELEDIQGEFDVVMLHHSLEHMPDSTLAFQHIHRLLKPGKYAVVRIPVASSYAWRQYGIDWSALEAPRHFFLHTRKSMEILAQDNGFLMEDVVYDSTSYQFWVSEQNRQGISLMDKRSYYINPDSSIFTAGQIQEFESRARELNAKGDGDAACFYLRKV